MWLRRSGLMLAAAVVLSSCGGDIPARAPFAAPAERADGASCATQTCIYVTGNAAQSHHPHDNKVLAFSRDADGNAPPVSSIEGTKTHLVYPRAVALDGARNLYVSNYTPLEKQSNVAVFAPGASGNTPPLRTISGPDTQLQAPSAISLDPAGNLYVIDSYGAASGCSDPTGGCWTVNVYAARAAGDAAPVRSIRGPATKLYYAYGSAVDARGNVYVADGYHVNCCVTVYSAGASGNVKPVRTIQGSRTDLAVPVGIALDSHANVYVLNAEGSPTRSVTVYAAGAAVTSNRYATSSDRIRGCTRLRQESPSTAAAASTCCNRARATRFRSSPRVRPATSLRFASLRAARRVWRTRGRSRCASVDGTLAAAC